MNILDYVTSNNVLMNPIDYSINVLAKCDDLEDFAILANKEYRAGNPIIEDWIYDQIVIAAIKLKDTNSILLDRVEPDEFQGKTVELPVRMLSTDKAYTKLELSKWQDRISKESGKSTTILRVTPKLDGFAAYKDNNSLYTRGNGYSGTDISRALDRGLMVIGNVTSGKGEIVVDKDYFKEKLSHLYDNSRNIISAVIKESELDTEIQTAIWDGAVVFYPFSELPFINISNNEMIDTESLWEKLVETCAYDTDGLVLEVIDEDIKELMGFTGHHFCWQIAFKKNTEFHDIKVIDITPQTSKVGRIIPVVELEPTTVSGVVISRATGHNWGNIIKLGIDTNAIVKLCRSGLVIPYIASVVEPVVHVHIPDTCPSCGSPTRMEDDTLWCTNDIDCPAQIERTIEYFFKTIDNLDGFGPSTIETLVSNGFNSVVKIYNMNVNDFIRCGFGDKTSENLFNQLHLSRVVPLFNWKFLAAFSINSVGKGGCEQLLKHYKLDEVFSLTKENIIAISGFGEKTAENLLSSLVKIKPDFDTLMEIGFNLVEPKIINSNGLTGKTIVFTGTFYSDDRKKLESNAKAMGIKVGSSVSSKTDYLIIGDKVGATKTNAAKQHGVNVITEDEYLEMIK